MITVSTVNITNPASDAPAESENALLSLPYSDDFGYSDEFLSSRGNARILRLTNGTVHLIRQLISAMTAGIITA